MLHLVALAVASAPAGGELLTNGGFEEGLRAWNQACTSPSCGAVKTNAPTHRSGNSGILLSCTADSWTSLQLRQSLPDPLPPGQLSLQAWVQAAHGELPAVRVGVTLEFEDASGSPLAGCSRTRDEMPSASEWSLLATQCAVPASATRGWAALEWACVRSEATLLVDDASLRYAAEKGAAELMEASDAPVTLPGEQVPRRLHLIFGLAADFGGKPFGLVHHLVIKAAVHALRPAGGRAVFYHAHEPQGLWWEASRRLLELRKVQAPTTIFGRHLRRFAHQADVLRLELLQQWGGVYMDMDILVISPLDALHRYELSMAHEGVEGTIGLGNALMLARPNASLLRVWYERYRGFSDAVWNGFSLRLPFELAQQMPESVHTVDYAKFYWPPWNPWGIAQLYRTQTCIMAEQQAVHLWETKVWQSLLGKLTPEMVREGGTCFTRLAAAIMDDTYDFSAARVAPNQLAHRNDTVVFSTSLLSRLLNPAPPSPPAAGGAGAAAALPRASASCVNNAGAACIDWAANGECAKNPGFMSTACHLACGC